MNENKTEIDGIILPYITVAGVKYYPIRYVLEKVMLKSSTSLHTKEKYKPYIKKCIIDWTFAGTVPQEGNCMNKEGWIYYIKHCKQNKNKDNNKIRRNNLMCEYLGYEEGKIIEMDKINKDELYDEYILDCIKAYKDKGNRIESAVMKKCCVCGRELPNSYYFFHKDNRIKSNITNTCRLCSTNPLPYLIDNKPMREVYKDFGIGGYISYKNNIHEFYNKYIINQNKIKMTIPEGTDRMDFILKIVKGDYIRQVLTKENLNIEYIKTFYKSKIHKGMSHLSNKLIIEYCSEDDCKVRPYLYPHYISNIQDLKQANLVLDTYIEDNNIIVDDILNYNGYERLFKDAKISCARGDSLSFIVQYYGYEYAGYKFKLSSPVYYKSRENCIFDMKWFIEKDRKIVINKIPLYITKTSLHNLAPSLYHVLNIKKCFNSLYEWINVCYPDMYTENDFDMNPYRCEFDSLEESQVHDTLINNLTGVIYNTRNRPDTVCIDGMIPDWIICNNKGCWLVEYFGLYSNGDYQSSHRLIKYHEKMKTKLDKYTEIEKVGYKTLFIYPEDIRNGFDGLLSKIEMVK